VGRSHGDRVEETGVRYIARLVQMAHTVATLKPDQIEGKARPGNDAAENIGDTSGDDRMVIR